MLREAKEELICDFAETYHIYDLRQFSVQYIAILAKGLHPESRTKMKIGEAPTTFERLAMATLIDGVNILIWQNTKSGRSGKHRPQSVVDRLINREKSDEVEGFSSAVEYEKAREALLGGGQHA